MEYVSFKFPNLLRTTLTLFFLVQHYLPWPYIITYPGHTPIFQSPY